MELLAFRCWIGLIVCLVGWISWGRYEKTEQSFGWTGDIRCCFVAFNLVGVDVSCWRNLLYLELNYVGICWSRTEISRDPREVMSETDGLLR